MVNVEEISDGEKLQIAFSIRKLVFIDEQGVDESEEYDEHEPLCRHFLINSEKTPVGTARLRTTGSSAKLERFAILKEFRRKGMGTTLLHHLLEEARLDAPQKIYLHAQIEVKDFYKNQGFVEVGESFQEAGIEHIKMEYRNPI